LGTPEVVVVRRVASGWQTTVAGKKVFARSLAALDTKVRRQFGGHFAGYRFQTGSAELDRMIHGIRFSRAAVQWYAGSSRRMVERVIMLQSGLSQRDMGMLIGLSHQRIHQLRVQQRASLVEGQPNGPNGLE
jgi:hypothetical protein